MAYDFGISVDTARSRIRNMSDLTKGPVTRHLLQLAAFIALTSIFQTLFFLVDLYFVGQLGKEAIAGVGLAGNIMMVVLALSQALGVGATTLIAHAAGRKDHPRAELLFNQSLVLSSLVGLGFGVSAFLLRHAYASGLAADVATAEQGAKYLAWFVPAMALQFGLVGMGSALRAFGDVKVPTAIQVGTLFTNIILAPVLIAGWGTGRPLGVTGAALATFIAISGGTVAFVLYFRRAASPVRFRREHWRPQPRLWREMLVIGLPAGGEFAMMAVYVAVVYGIIQTFGAAAQAGFGIGVRVMQSMFLPGMAIGFATAPVVGQNFGARQNNRVRQTYYSALSMSALVMFILSLLCHIAPHAMVRVFSSDEAVVKFGVEYLRIISWNFVATGVVFASSSTLQGMGNTLPSLAASALRLLTFALPATLMSRRSGFQMRHVWYLSVASVAVQAVLAVALVHREFRRKLA